MTKYAICVLFGSACSLTENLSQALPLSTTLSISLLACWHAREALNPLDIGRAALDGKLPFLDFAKDNKEALQPFSNVLARSLLAPSGRHENVFLFHYTMHRGSGGSYYRSLTA